jgi:hypothetical protein
MPSNGRPLEKEDFKNFTNSYYFDITTIDAKFSHAHIVIFPCIKYTPVHYSKSPCMQQICITFEINNTNPKLLSR